MKIATDPAGEAEAPRIEAEVSACMTGELPTPLIAIGSLNAAVPAVQRSAICRAATGFGAAPSGPLPPGVPPEVDRHPAEGEPC